MLRIAFVVLFFIFQLYLVLSGVKVFGVYLNPLLLFLVSVLIPVLYYKTLLSAQAQAATAPLRRNPIPGILLGIASITLCIPALQAIFNDFPDPSKSSDVIPQIESLYHRAMAGEQPYYELAEFAWHPFPVYMPLHWLPLAITDLLNLDSRWAGVSALIVAGGIWGVFSWRYSRSIIAGFAALVLPALVLAAFIWENKPDIGVSFELIIAAYYLILATGLAKNSFYLTLAGIILCLLSRYTMVFWLPLFLLLLWIGQPKTKSYIMVSGIAAAFLVFYILPFFIRDPGILLSGVNYHNGCAISEWDFHRIGISHTFREGLFFGPYFYDILSGSMEQRVFIMRSIQGTVMIGLVAAGLLLYKKWKGRMSIYEMSLPMLYLCLLLFFMFSPLVYRYYYLPLLMISAVLCGKIILAMPAKK